MCRCAGKCAVILKKSVAVVVDEDLKLDCEFLAVSKQSPMGAGYAGRTGIEIKTFIETTGLFRSSDFIDDRPLPESEIAAADKIVGLDQVAAIACLVENSGVSLSTGRAVHGASSLCHTCR